MAVVSADIITGVDSKGTFNGEADMTRAQAAVTLCRLADVIEAKENGTLPGPDDKPDPKPEPEPEPDPGDHPTAKVPTEAEAYDILMQIRAEYPHGTPWGNDKTYHSPNYGTATFSGCAAFTQMLATSMRMDCLCIVIQTLMRSRSEILSLKTIQAFTRLSLLRKRQIPLSLRKVTLALKFAGVERLPVLSWRATIMELEPFIQIKQFLSHERPPSIRLVVFFIGD